MVLSPSKLVILHWTVIPIALLRLVPSKSEEEVESKGSILMNSVSSMILLTIDVRT